MASTGEARKIMTKPLPEILDEIEDSIRLADEAVKNAREAAVEARKAGEQAAIEVRKSGDKAIREATLAINERIDRVEQIANKSLQLAELLKLALTEGNVVVDKIISGKSPDAKSAPKQ